MPPPPPPRATYQGPVALLERELRHLLPRTIVSHLLMQGSAANKKPPNFDHWAGANTPTVRDLPLVDPTHCPSDHFALADRETETQSKTEDFAYAQVLLFIETGQI